MHRQWTARLLLIGTLVAALFGLGAADTAHAQQPPATTLPPAAGQGLAGTLTAAGEPVEGATITVTDAEGNEVAEVESGEDGAWSVPVPAPGAYTITLDEDSLPDDVSLQEGRRSEVTLTVVSGRTGQAAFPLAGADGDEGGPSGAGGRSFFEELTQKIVNGIKFGLIIAMAAVGLSLIFGTTGLVNFAHGEMVTFGAIAAWFLNTAGIHIGPFDIAPAMHLIPAAVLAVVLGAALGGALDLGVFRPMRKRSTGAFQILVMSIGLSLALRQLLLMWFGERSLEYHDYTIQKTWTLGPVEITPRDLVIMGLSVLTLLAVGGMLQFTRVGRAMRAVSDDTDLAESSGVDVQRIILVVWLTGGALAAFGGVLFGTATNVNYLNGFQILLLMFAGIILGGLGTAFGAVIGSLVVGIATEVSTVWLSSELKYAWALALLIAVLMFRPQGILGVRERVA